MTNKPLLDQAPRYSALHTVDGYVEGVGHTEDALLVRKGENLEWYPLSEFKQIEIITTGDFYCTHYKLSKND